MDLSLQDLWRSSDLGKNLISRTPLWKGKKKDPKLNVVSQFSWKVITFSAVFSTQSHLWFTQQTWKFDFSSHSVCTPWFFNWPQSLLAKVESCMCIEIALTFKLAIRSVWSHKSGQVYSEDLQMLAHLGGTWSESLVHNAAWNQPHFAWLGVSLWALHASGLFFHVRCCASNHQHCPINTLNASA